MDPEANESSKLLGLPRERSRMLEENGIFSSSESERQASPRSPWRIGSAVGFLLLFAVVAISSCSSFPLDLSSLKGQEAVLVGWEAPGPNESVVLGPASFNETINSDSDAFTYDQKAKKPEVSLRCEWVVEQFQNRDMGSSPEELAEKYHAQSVDFNVFYRATAHIFWTDFVFGHWGKSLVKNLRNDAELKGGVPLDAKSTYTWVTGDQHLSNFGAFRNRHGDIVFGVNDFDEAAIYDFQVDILRIAVSIYNHALTNGLKKKHVRKALRKFTDTYVKTAIDYIGNEDALLFELTKKTTSGKLKKFLKSVKSGSSYEKQMQKYTNTNNVTGFRYFQKGPIGQPDPDTKLAAVSPERENQIRSVFTATHYGATMMKLGWGVEQWDEDFFTVMDVAARIGSGVGSYGVDRYYVLLKGTDDLLYWTKSKEGRTAVVLDVKYEPQGAVSKVLTPEEEAWYSVLFPNDAARAVAAQRALTSYTDPYTGWVMLPDEKDGTLMPFLVRQRSPWKDSYNLDKLTDSDDFIEYMNLIAVSTATSHVRGSVGKKPGDFKHVIRALLGEKKKRRKWGKEVAKLAASYHEQVLLDYGCFAVYVNDTYPSEESN